MSAELLEALRFGVVLLDLAAFPGFVVASGTVLAFVWRVRRARRPEATTSFHDDLVAAGFYASRQFRLAVVFFVLWCVTGWALYR